MDASRTTSPRHSSLEAPNRSRSSAWVGICSRPRRHGCSSHACEGRRWVSLWHRVALCFAGLNSDLPCCVVLCGAILSANYCSMLGDAPLHWGASFCAIFSIRAMLFILFHVGSGYVAPLRCIVCWALRPKLQPPNKRVPCSRARLHSAERPCACTVIAGPTAESGLERGIACSSVLHDIPKAPSVSTRGCLAFSGSLCA